LHVSNVAMLKMFVLIVKIDLRNVINAGNPFALKTVSRPMHLLVAVVKLNCVVKKSQ
jgi:hypothetical protein